jgi:ankyrin repeat protein
LARASDALGNNPLHWSVMTRQLALIDRFVNLGTPMEAQRADGQTPVLLAVNGATDYWFRTTRGRSHPSLRNTSVLVGNLLAHGATYSISVAAAVGDQERVEELVKKDESLANCLDLARISPLSYAAREGHLHIVRLLLERGADPNLPEDAAPQGRALFEACCANHLQIAELLLEHGANPNAGTDSNGCCLTIVEVYHGEKSKPMQALLRQHGAYTPSYAMGAKELKQAICSGHDVIPHEEILDCVIWRHDAKMLDLFIKSDRSAACIRHWTGAYPKSPTLVKQLLSHGLDPNRPDWLGKTFLHACAENGDRTVAAIFLNAGADINARDVEFNGTPLAAAVRCVCADHDTQQARRRIQMVEFLLKRGAATNLPGDKRWATPLAWASRKGRSDLVELLKQHGATAE